MQTHFTAEQLADPDTAESARILRSCVHCGFCTATCPTYTLLGDELDSPRGRIYLIKEMLENDRPATATDVKHIDRCLSCLSCMTTCPSGVNYMHLVDHARAHIERTFVRPWPDRLFRRLLAVVLPRPLLFRPAMMVASLVKPLGRFLPGPLRTVLVPMLALVPRTVPDPSPVDAPQVFPAIGERRCRVALLTGCAQQVLAPSINEATIRLLTRHGCEVVVARGAGCCGALKHHLGQGGHGAARANVLAWTAEAQGAGLDAIVINASGCGTTVKDYGFMFRDDADLAAPAAAVSALARDITELMTEIGLMAPSVPTGLRVAYHSACSLQHGQRGAGRTETIAGCRGVRRGRRAGGAPLLRLGRHLQPAAAGDRGTASRSQGGEHRTNPARRDRGRQHRLPDADRIGHRLADRAHGRAAGLGHGRPRPGAHRTPGAEPRNDRLIPNPAQETFGMTWNQVYDPMGNMALSAALAALPVVVMLVSLAFLHIAAHWAAIMALAVAIACAVLGFGMPAQMALGAAGLGILSGLFPIGWIVLNIIFLYRLTVANGSFAILQRAIAGVTPDRRLQLLLIAFAFGAFFEGAAGFGTPVAVTAAILIGLGFSPLAASGLSLIANTAPVAFGALASPVIALSAVTGIDLDVLSAMIGRQLPLFSLMVPFWLIWAFAGWRAMIQIWPAILVTGLSFAVSQFVVSNYIGPMLVDVISALVCMGCLVGFLRVWHPAQIWTSAALRGKDPSAGLVLGRPMAGGAVGADITLDRPALIRAWLPWLILTVFVFAWGLPGVRAALNGVYSTGFQIPGLHLGVIKSPPVVAKAAPEAAIWAFNILSMTGTGILLASILAGLLMRFSLVGLVAEYGRTIWKVRMSLITIAAMLGLGTVTKFSGLDATMGWPLPRRGFCSRSSAPCWAGSGSR